MPARLPKADSDIKVWGLALNDALRILHGNDTIIIAKNGDNPPTVKAGTRFFRWNTDTYLTPLTPPTGNNSYPVNTNVTYPVSDVVFEQSDVTFAWGAGGLPSKSNSTVYYLYCTGTNDVDAAGRGKGIYMVGTTAPTLDESKGGWYDVSGNRHLCAFFVNSSGKVVSLINLENRVKAFYIAASTVTSVELSGFDSDNNLCNLEIESHITLGATTDARISLYGMGGNIYSSQATKHTGTTTTTSTVSGSFTFPISLSTASGNHLSCMTNINIRSGYYPHITSLVSAYTVSGGSPVALETHIITGGAASAAVGINRLTISGSFTAGSIFIVR